MNPGTTSLERLRQQIDASVEPDTPSERIRRFHYADVAGLLYVDFYGEPSDEPYEALLATLSEAAVAARLASLWLRGPDEGANGTESWDLCPLVDPAPHFPVLREFQVQQARPGDHNRPIIASVYDEEGVLARLLAKAPQLRALTVPSAPSVEFFQVGERPIQYLNVDTGYDHQNFILNLSASSCFPALGCLEFGEYSETYLEGFEQGYTPLAHYEALFRSPALQRVHRFVWRDPQASDAEIATLHALRPDLGLLVVRTSSEYVRPR